MDSWTKIFMICRLPLILAAFALSGCVHTAVVKRWQPAQIDVAGLQRVAVIDFSGEHGSAVSAAFADRLSENQFYSLVDRSEFQPVLRTSFTGDPQADLNSTLTAARAADIDAVIVGEVVTCACADREARKSDFLFGHSRDSESRSLESVAPASGSVSREGNVTIAFRLVDVKTGEVRASKEVSRHFVREAAHGGASLPPPAAVLESLVDECVAESVCLLAPHETICSMKLACSDMFCLSRRGVQKGVDLAREGNWSAAEKAWEKVLADHPASDAAMFNLALAAAQRQDYATAESRAMQALRVRHRDAYAQGLEQIRAQRAAFQETERQREDQIIPAMASAWD